MSDQSFEKELSDLDSKGLKRMLPKDFSGVNLSSNDYLGLSQDLRVQAAAIQVIKDSGTGGTSSRLLAGTAEVHRQLEKKICSFFSKDASLVFSSGYHVNTGVLSVVAGAGDIIFVDRLAHASILDGIKMSEARFATFEHNNLDHLSRLLSERRKKYRRAWVVTEGIFSMDGDIPPLKELVTLAHHHDALVYLDEAHSIGVRGPDGKGLAAERGVLDQIDLLVGTLSKSLASQGGFVAARNPIIELLMSKCRSFIYTTALAPAAAGAALASLELLPQMEERRKNLQSWGIDLRKGLHQLGYDTGASETLIVPVMTGTIEVTQKLSSHLLSQGFFVPSIRPPTVPVGEGRVRLSLTHTAAEKGKSGLLEAFATFPDRPQRKKEKIGNKS